MALPEKSEIVSDQLHLFVVGPGKGETLLLRIPPDQWIIIDSFEFGEPTKPAAEAIVSRYGGKVAILALTHPHRDHCDGFIELINRYVDAILGCVHPRDAGVADAMTNDAVAALRPAAQRVYDRIWGEWMRDEGRRWDTFRGERRKVGDATVTSIHPIRPVNPNQWSRDPNAISSAMLVEWGNTCLLVGADVPNTEWPGIGATFRRLHEHAAMKVPHHGSREAIHDVFGDGTPGRFWVITPFSPQNLPRAADEARNGEQEGLSRALSCVREVRLTSLPFRHDCEHEAPCVTSRGEIRDGTRPVQNISRDEAFMATTAPLDRQIVVAFDRNGRVVNEWYGPGSARIGR